MHLSRPASVCLLIRKVISVPNREDTQVLKRSKQFQLRIITSLTIRWVDSGGIFSLSTGRRVTSNLIWPLAKATLSHSNRFFGQLFAFLFLVSGSFVARTFKSLRLSLSLSTCQPWISLIDRVELEMFFLRFTRFVCFRLFVRRKMRLSWAARWRLYRAAAMSDSDQSVPHESVASDNRHSRHKPEKLRKPKSWEKSLDVL